MQDSSKLASLSLARKGNLVTVRCRIYLRQGTIFLLFYYSPSFFKVQNSPASRGPIRLKTSELEIRFHISAYSTVTVL